MKAPLEFFKASVATAQTVVPLLTGALALWRSSPPIVLGGVVLAAIVAGAYQIESRLATSVITRLPEPVYGQRIRRAARWARYTSISGLVLMCTYGVLTWLCAPVVVAVIPRTPIANTIVTIYGKHFPESKRRATVEIDGYPARVLFADDDSLRVQVPEHAFRGELRLSRLLFGVIPISRVHDMPQVRHLEHDVVMTIESCQLSAQSLALRFSISNTMQDQVVQINQIALKATRGTGVSFRVERVDLGSVQMLRVGADQESILEPDTVVKLAPRESEAFVFRVKQVIGDSPATLRLSAEFRDVGGQIELVEPSAQAILENSRCHVTSGK